MKLVLHIEGPIGVDKTSLAQFIENKLREEYSVEFVGHQKVTFPLRKEVFRYNVAPF